MKMGRGLLVGALVAALAACTPPEAERVQGGGPGADRGNRSALVEMHGGSRMFYGTPCVTATRECTGPAPVAGLPHRDRVVQN
jgi:hypothetical protein